MTEYHILNLGAGVQSTTLYLMFMRGELPVKLDCAIFADTQEEPGAVYEHLEWLKSLKGPEILVRTCGKLGDDLTHGRNTTGQRFAAIPAFTTANGGGDVGRTRRQCSKEYKTEVIQRTIRREVLGLAPGRRVPRTTKVHQSEGAGSSTKHELRWCVRGGVWSMTHPDRARIISDTEAASA